MKQLSWALFCKLTVLGFVCRFHLKRFGFAPAIIAYCIPQLKQYWIVHREITRDINLKLSAILNDTHHALLTKLVLILLFFLTRPIVSWVKTGAGLGRQLGGKTVTAGLAVKKRGERGAENQPVHVTLPCEVSFFLQQGDKAKLPPRNKTISSLAALATSKENHVFTGC